MTIDVWARQEADEYAHGDVYGEIEPAFRDGVVMFADALLSEKTWGFLPDWNDEEGESITKAQAVRLLQAAIAAVTDPKPHDSEKS